MPQVYDLHFYQRVNGEMVLVSFPFYAVVKKETSTAPGILAKCTYQGDVPVLHVYPSDQWVSVEPRRRG